VLLFINTITYFVGEGVLGILLSSFSVEVQDAEGEPVSD
jgi:hypothetical protein